MKLFATLAALGLVASGYALSVTKAPGDAPEVGKPAPEINAKDWVNNLGGSPSLAALRGQAVVLEFWATW
jgi:hypothetical protein